MGDLPALLDLCTLLDDAERAAEAGELARVVRCLVAVQAQGQLARHAIAAERDPHAAIRAERFSAQLLRRLRALVARLSPRDCAYAISAAYAN